MTKKKLGCKSGGGRGYNEGVVHALWVIISEEFLTKAATPENEPSRVVDRPPFKTKTGMETIAANSFESNATGE